MKEAIDLKRALETAKTKSEELHVHDGGMMNYSSKSDRKRVILLTHSSWYII